jgi:hypothetical protein
VGGAWWRLCPRPLKWGEPLNPNEQDALLRKIMEIEHRYSSDRKNERSERKEKLKELVDSAAAAEGDDNAASQG